MVVVYNILLLFWLRLVAFQDMMLPVKNSIAQEINGRCWMNAIIRNKMEKEGRYHKTQTSFHWNRNWKMFTLCLSVHWKLMHRMIIPSSKSKVTATQIELSMHSINYCCSNNAQCDNNDENIDNHFLYPGSQPK